MKTIRKSNENEMILEFLQGELKSDRFKEKLLSITNNIDIIQKGDTKNEEENKIRYQIMKEYRGYPDQDMFNNFPKIQSWGFVELDSTDIDKMYYINYDYWNELSKNTSKPIEAAKTIRSGIEIYEVSNQPFIDGLKYSNFPPVILISCNKDKYLIIEGHSRMTIYGLNPEKMNNTYAYVGNCTKEEMSRYDKRMI